MTNNLALAEIPTYHLPYIVGPDLYELYTDARFFITKVYVNDIELKLRMSNGNGMISRHGHSFSGDLGYHNKINLNTYLTPGANKIKVVFEPSTILEDAQKEGAEEIIIRDMFAHAVLNRGKLHHTNVSSYELDQLIASPDLEADIIGNTLLRRFTEEKLNSPTNIIFEIKITDDENAIQSTLADCKLDNTTSVNFSATLMLNNKTVQKIEDNSTQTINGISDALKDGKNIFQLNVTSINNTDMAHIDLYLNCNLKKYIAEANFKPEHQNEEFGRFGAIDIPLTRIEFSEPGEYQDKFDFKF